MRNIFSFIREIEISADMDFQELLNIAATNKKNAEKEVIYF